MSGLVRRLARNLEAVFYRRRDGKTVMRQHRRGDNWWRKRFAELVERRAA